MKHIIILSLFIHCFLSKTYAVSSEIEPEQPSIFLDSIAYNYEIQRNESGGYWCVGNLEFIVNMPVGIASVWYEQTGANGLRFGRPIFTIKSIYTTNAQDTTINIMRDNVKWDAYFRVLGYFEDNSCIISPTYCVKPYVNDEDINLLEGQASIENAVSTPVNIYVKEGRLIVETFDEAFINVNDLNGNLIYEGEISRTASIPLSNVSSHFIIVKYSDYNITFTKKILVL